ncbi:MAG: hypothetical protein IKB31_01255 [Bacteroidaceae bacterium]|nr:hypothetical protein [Bacteroidaceae bacterium]
MKKNNLNKVFTSLLVCMLAVSAFVLKGCKDENEDDSYLIELVVPVYETNNEVGTLFYSESTNSWIIVSDSIIQLPNDTLSERMIIYELIDTGIDEAEREKYNNLIGEKVIFSGEYIGNHPLPAGKTQDYAYLVGYGYYIRCFNHVEISSFKSRSIDTEELIVECGTKSNMPPIWFFSREIAEGIDYTSAYQMNVFVHVVRPSNGSASSEYTKASVSSTILNNLNTYFANTNISFVLSGSDYIDSDAFVNMSVSDFKNDISSYLSINRVSNAINIYVMSEAPYLENNVSARSEQIIGTAFLVVKDYYKFSTISHEMGHCLGLYHTHHGTSPNERPSGSCMELVDGSNSSTCGDYITDTPADPYSWEGCTYNGTDRDANGDIYVPDPSNLMAYSFLTCRNHFTQKQVECMHHVLSYSNAHQLAATITNREITGPTQIGSSSTYTYTINVPSNATVQWSIDCSSYASGSSSPNKYTVSGTGSTITLQNRYPNALSQKYVINATIYIGSGNQRYEYYATKTVYKISNPIQTGTLTWSSESPCGNYLGTINMSTPNNSTIKLHKGGILTFHYTDVCGAYSYTDTDVFNFEIYNLNAIKEVGANHVFLIQPYATAPANGKIMLSLMINGMGTMFQIPVEVLPCSQIGWNSLEDSTDVEISILEDSISFVTQ